MRFVLAAILALLGCAQAQAQAQDCNVPPQNFYYITSDYNSGTQAYAIASASWVLKGSDAGYLAFVAQGCTAPTLTAAQLLAPGGPVEALKVSNFANGNAWNLGFPIITGGTVDQVLTAPIALNYSVSFSAPGHTVTLPAMASINSPPLGVPLTFYNNGNANPSFSVADANTNTITVIQPGYGVTFVAQTNTNSAGTVATTWRVLSESGYAIYLNSVIGTYMGSGASIVSLTQTCGSHSWFSSVSNSLVPSCTQPAFTDISGNLTGGQLPVAGVSATKTVRASGGASDCSLIFTNGQLTGGTC